MPPSLNIAHLATLAVAGTSRATFSAPTNLSPRLRAAVTGDSWHESASVWLTL